MATLRILKTAALRVKVSKLSAETRNSKDLPE